ncbi:MAG: hypothetical protein FP817_09885 [Propionicimonas sp.]|nr:hypothetical protein [Propionicimonas sp.]
MTTRRPGCSASFGPLHFDRRAKAASSPGFSCPHPSHRVGRDAPRWQNGSSRQLTPPKATTEETEMGKGGRKRRSRRKNAANHGKRPNA